MSIVRVDSEVEKKGKISQYSRYFISSLPANADLHLNIIRKHWEIENVLHWSLDCTFNENAALNLSTARKISLNIFNAIKDDKTSVRSYQRKCWKPMNAIKILSNFENA